MRKNVRSQKYFYMTALHTDEETARDQQSFRSTFDSIVSKLRWLGTQGVNFFLNSWYAKQPMFWLPVGWIPYHADRKSVV